MIEIVNTYFIYGDDAQVLASVDARHLGWFASLR